MFHDFTLPRICMCHIRDTYFQGAAAFTNYRLSTSILEKSVAVAATTKHSYGNMFTPYPFDIILFNFFMSTHLNR